MNTKEQVQVMMTEINSNWNSCDDKQDTKNMKLLAKVLSIVMNWNETERKEFDDKYAFEMNWNEHGYKNSGTKLHFSSKGIIISEDNDRT